VFPVILYVTEATRDNAISFQFVLACLPEYVALILFVSLGCTVYSFCVGVYVISVPGYNVDSLSTSEFPTGV
jgi:hypothetical protein